MSSFVNLVVTAGITPFHSIAIVVVFNAIKVAYASGFNNISNFNRQFKTIKHMNPRTYRKAI